jgi:hypothetical protein
MDRRKLGISAQGRSAGGFSAVARTMAPPTRQDYRGFLTTLTRRGDYVALPRWLAQRLGLDAAAVLVNLLNVGQLRADSEGFVMMTPKFNCNGLGLDEDREAEAMTKLAQLRIVHIEYRNHERYACVDLKRLETILSKGG